MEPDSLDIDEKTVSQDFMLEQIKEFFETRRSVVLVDLDALEKPKVQEIELMAESPKK